jgi:hypothetical protein
MVRLLLFWMCKYRIENNTSEVSIKWTLTWSFVRSLPVTNIDIVS